MTTIETPALAGSRRRAQQALEVLPDDLTGADIALSSRGVLAAAVSFVDEIVVEVLVRRHARSLKVLGATDPELIDYFTQRAIAHSVADRLQFDS